ncbi:hypothetical protein NRF20_44270 [Streptomyces sp. R-74717]|uniref:hypothetical protein n=1 Tax=Streptomyces TaxID=1883 RepID=UPI0037AF78E5
MRALGAKAFPDAETVLDDALSPIEAIRAQRRRQPAATMRRSADRMPFARRVRSC